MADTADRTQIRIARWSIALSGVAVVAVAVAALTLGRSATPPPDSVGGSGGALGMCLAFSTEELQARDFAFDGTVTAINGNKATFLVNDGLWGVETGSSVTLAADLMIGDAELVALEGGPQLLVDERYLITGDETYAWSCGFSRVWDAATAAEWATLAP